MKRVVHQAWRRIVGTMRLNEERESRRWHTDDGERGIDAASTSEPKGAPGLHSTRLTCFTLKRRERRAPASLEQDRSGFGARFLALLVLVLLPLAPVTAAPANHSLRVEVLPQFNGQPLVFDALTNTTAAGQRIAIKRLDFLLSDVALRRTDGAWFALSNRFAYLSGREGRTTFSPGALPSGQYDRLRFQVGLPPTENHADPAGLPADHALNSNLNGLHWSWQGGYVFLAIEGDWMTEEGRVSGYSYHLASDRLITTVELPLSLMLTSAVDLRLALHVDQIFSVRHRLRIDEDSTSTHSRADDILADQLRDNVEQAFSVVSLRATAPLSSVVPQLNPVVMASNATPYRFTFSRHFPQPALPRDNPLTEEGVELGRRLFHEPRLSINNQQSCASCHQAEAAFTDGRRYSIGAEGQVGTRNAMPLVNLAWRNSFFWDGRVTTLREQVLQPIENPIEMHESLTNVASKLRSSRRKEAPTKTNIDQSLLTSAATNEMDYPALFSAAFGTPDITADRIARALEQFLLVQVSHHSKFDRSLAGEVELSAEEKRGFELFHTEYDPRRGQLGADCFHCHGGPLFQSQSFANNGLDAEFTDPGRFLATGKSGDRGKFAVPSLRNVAVTTPYMHDGRFATLEEVVAHYTTGVKHSATLDPNLAKHPDGGVPLSAEDQRALVAFLRTLTEERFIY